VRLMEYILSNPINRAFVLAKCSQQLEEVLELCTKVSSIVEEKLETKASIQEGESRLLPKVLQLVGTLSVLLSKTPLVRLEELLAWSERELCAVTSHSVEVTFSRMQVSLAQECLSAVASLGSTCLMLDLADPEFTEKLLDWSGQLLDQEDESQISTVMGVLVEAGTRALSSKGEAWKTIYNEKVLVAFAKVLSWLSHAGSGLEEGGEGAEALSKGVGALMKLYSKEAEYQAESWEDLVEVLLEMVIKVVTQEVEETGRVEMPAVLAQIGCIPAILLKAVLSAGGEGLLGQYLLTYLRTEDDKNKEDDDEEEDGPLTGTKIAAIFIINIALKLKISSEIQQEIENVIASRLLVDDVSDEEREMLDRVMTRLVEARADADHADVA